MPFLSLISPLLKGIVLLSYCCCDSTCFVYLSPLVLAKSEKVYNLVLDCYAVNQKEDYIEPTVRALVSTMGLDESEVRSRLTSDETKDSQYQVLKRQVTIEEKQAYEDYVSTDAEKKLTDEQIKERRNITGIWFEENYIKIGRASCRERVFATV